MVVFRIRNGRKPQDRLCADEKPDNFMSAAASWIGVDAGEQSTIVWPEAANMQESQASKPQDNLAHRGQRAVNLLSPATRCI